MGRKLEKDLKTFVLRIDDSISVEANSDIYYIKANNEEQAIKLLKKQLRKELRIRLKTLHVISPKTYEFKLKETETILSSIINDKIK